MKKMNFSEALNELKSGKKLKRAGWNGQDQYITIGSNVSWKESDGTIVNHKNECIGNSAIIFHGSLGTQVGWLASQGDMLSNDWMVVE